MDPVKIPDKLEVGSFTPSWYNSHCGFALLLRTPNLEEGEAVGGPDGTVRKSVGEFL